MADEDLILRVLEAGRKLCDASPSGETDQETIARVLDMDADDRHLYLAVKEARDRGALDCIFPGGIMVATLVRA